MGSLSLASGLTNSPDGFPAALPRVFSRSLQAPLGSGGELNSLLELLSSCREEPTSPLEVLDSLGILSLLLPLGGQGGDVLVGRGRSSAVQWPISPRVLVGQVAAPVSGGCLHVPPCSMTWLCGREEPTSLREVLDSLGILSLVLPPVIQGGGVLGGRGPSPAAQLLVSPHVLVGRVAALVSGGRLQVPPCSMAWFFFLFIFLLFIGFK